MKLTPVLLALLLVGAVTAHAQNRPTGGVVDALRRRSGRIPPLWVLSFTTTYYAPAKSGAFGPIAGTG